MDNLHSVIRTIRGETKSSRRDHLTVFREFLDHLERVSRRAPRGKAVRPKSKPPRRGK